MKVSSVHVVEHSLSEVSGYSVRTHGLLRALQRGGQDVVAVAPCAGSAAREEVVDGVRYRGVPTGADTRTLTGHLAGLLRLRSGVVETVRSQGASVVHAHSPGRIGLVGIAAARATGRPCLYEVRGLWEDAAVDRGKYEATSLRYRLTRRLETLALRRADAVAALGRPLRGEIISRGVASDRVFTVTNGVAAEHFLPRERRRDLVEEFRLEDAFVIGYIGYFYRYEGVDVLLRAFARTLARVPHAKLLLVGAGDMEAELRALASELEVDSHVVFVGAVPHGAVPDHHALCDVVVYPRRRSRNTELMTPLKPLEAMSMGRAVVVSDVSGLREVTGVAARSFHADDPKSLAEALEHLANDISARRDLERQARDWTALRSWDHVVADYEPIYARLSGRVG